MCRSSPTARDLASSAPAAPRLLTLSLAVLVLTASVSPCRAWKTVEQYKALKQVGAYGNNLILTQQNLQAVRDRCEQALDMLANNWHHPSTRMHNLAKPSFAFRLQDQPPRPLLQHLMQPATAAPMWRALLERVLTFVDPEWRAVHAPWSLEHLCYRFIVTQGANLPVGPPNACLPINRATIPPAAGPFHTRHYVAAHPDGYIMVNLGTDDNGEPLAIPLHTVITFAFRGPPQPVNQVPVEVGHLCGNPWCINHAHLVWCTHTQNCNHVPDPDA